MKRTIAALILALAAGQAMAATAFFTGRQEMVQTVTYRMVWRCEYQYAGQHFYFLFEGSCPSSVEVR